MTKTRKEEWRVTYKEIEWLDKVKDERWNVEEVLVQNNMLDRVENHKDPSSCPICDEQLKEGDLYFQHWQTHSCEVFDETGTPKTSA